ncbi:hypothetical protein A2272_04330 [Candidatus Peregrinibacteria bacterium RIFOXYA12_FULL_33_12]|nr:MAG: hypothetical protein A2263_02915 [Candidatus Peregrinibacteria bacterium RIFOXYA2_FULL_33_21]OGJ47464.1 MAG: hypothetical protein A2272_04330 [Candidatus Peregrinibacteria bacterium RIFOXYA12_FULL_33_12]OGJ50733.1 MAG: hypothetical protein A2307_03730 [Candidatus Peregrinibacteria bacterium RIFOXYB2_FULL_33_20]
MGLHNYEKPQLYTIDAKVEEINDQFAILKSACNIEFRWPTEKLPPKINIGDSVKLKLITKETGEEEKYTEMRNLLNAIVD